MTFSFRIEPDARINDRGVKVLSVGFHLYRIGRKFRSFTLDFSACGHFLSFFFPFRRLNTGKRQVVLYEHVFRASPLDDRLMCDREWGLSF